MVGHFLRLKVALLIGGLRAGSPVQKVGSILTFVMAIGGGIFGFWAASSLRYASDPTQSYLVKLRLAVIFAIWVVGALITAGGDASMDPTRFALLPLTRRDLALGLGVHWWP